MFSSKRFALLVAVLFTLVGSTLLLFPVRGEQATTNAPIAAFSGCNINKKIDDFYVDGFVLAALQKDDQKKNDTVETWSVAMRAGGKDWSTESLNNLREYGPIEEKARLFLTSASQLVVFYYTEDNDLIGKRFELKDGTLKSADIEMPKENYMDNRNTPLFDIVGSSKGFYHPVRCRQIDGKEKINTACKRDCITIDTYCIFDHALSGKVSNNPLVYPMPANLEGGPRRFKFNTVYNALRCNGFQTSKNNDGKNMTVVNNFNEEDKNYTCISDLSGKHAQLQIYAKKYWDDKKPENCITLDGLDLGPPKSLVPTTQPGSVTQAAHPEALNRENCVLPWRIIRMIIVAGVAALLVTVSAVTLVFIDYRARATMDEMCVPSASGGAGLKEE